MKTNQKTDILSDLLDSISPIDQHITDTRMQIASKIAEALREKGMNKSDLMRRLGRKNPSEITRWLSGTQNLTCDTIAAIEYALDIKLFNVDEQQKERTLIVYVGEVTSKAKNSYDELLNSVTQSLTCGDINILS
jgi:transcriptional regulator with XRE-family HTH domain